MATLPPQDRGPTTPRNAVPGNAPFFSRLLSFSSQKKQPHDDDVHNRNGNAEGRGGTGKDQEEEEDESNKFHVRSSSASDRWDKESMTSSNHYNNDGDDSALYNDVCGTIDDCMFGLHTAYTPNEETPTLHLHDRVKLPRDYTNLSYTHDWILDGTDDSEGESLLLLDEEVHNNNNNNTSRTQNKKVKRRRKFGDAALDQMLGMLEIENASYTTSGSTTTDDGDGDGESCSPGNDTINSNEYEGGNGGLEEVIEFADFSCFGDDDDDTDGNSTTNITEMKEKLSASEGAFKVDNNLQHDVLYEYENNETQEEESQDVVSNNEKKGSEENISEEEEFGPFIMSPTPYKPPQSIECLVLDLDAELDVTIEKCLQLSPDSSALEENSDASSSSVNDACAQQLMQALSSEEPDLNEPPVEVTPQTRLEKTTYKQPLIMSSTLLETLPIPMPSLSSSPDNDDLVASLTRRIQTYHINHSMNKVGNNSVVQLEDELLEQKLLDTIHNGYFGNGSSHHRNDEECDNDSDHFDSIVLDEILNVPWPFHMIDLNEPILGEEEDSEPSESDESRSSQSTDPLNFDTYVANRLSELDFAAGEVMSCLLSRVSQKTDAINEGVENIFAAELDVTTSLMFSKSSREFLDRAKNGYPTQNCGVHNVVMAGLDVLQFAESKDRLRYLLETVDQISSICNQEAQWREDVNFKIIAPRRFLELVEDTRKLKNLVNGEEVLNHAPSLHTMRERLDKLPDILLGRIEQAVAELFARILSSDNNSSSAFDGYSKEYELLLQSWISCYQLKPDDNRNPVASEWSGCVLKLLCFEASRAFAGSMIDSYRDERIKTPNSDECGVIDDIESQLSLVTFASLDETGLLEELTSRLLVMRLGGGYHSGALASSFFHLCSRLVELMNLYSIILQWHMEFVNKQFATVDTHAISNDASDVGKSACGSSDTKSETKDTVVSSISVDNDSISETSTKDEMNTPQSAGPVPENLEYKSDLTSSVDDIKAVAESIDQIRRVLWKSCEVTLINLIEAYMSQSGDLGAQSGDQHATGNLRLTYDVLLQFTRFSLYFLDNEDGEEECSALKNELSKLYQRHFRSVHIEAMKTTGTLLRHESWHLAPLVLSGDNSKAAVNGSHGGEGNNEKILQTIYEVRLEFYI